MELALVLEILLIIFFILLFILVIAYVMLMMKNNKDKNMKQNVKIENQKVKASQKSGIKYRFSRKCI